MKIFQELGEILFPVRCFGCSTLGIEICSRCRKQWHAHIYRSSFDGLAVYSAVSYSPVAKRIILAAKESGIKSADQLIAGAIIHSLKYFLKERELGLLVPIPSRRSSNRLRGRDSLSEIVKAVSKEEDIDSASLLTHNRRVKDQTKLTARNRHHNLHGALSLQEGAWAEIKANSNVILIDDLVTTGASLIEARRALQARGIRVVGAVTACVSAPVR
jgi:predicted amidophosphoribosyltransferase